MSPYQIAHAAAWVNAALIVVGGGLAAASATPLHPSWLTPDIGLTAGIAASVCGGLATILPQIQRTPAKREDAYMAAFAGALPDDLARKHPTLSTRREEPADPSVPGPGV